MCSWDNIYSSITYEWSGKEFKAGLTGNKSFIWAAGVMAVIACAMTAIDAAVLARTMHTCTARARPGEQPPKMTGIHNSSCMNTGSSRCVTYPSAQQTNGAPAAGASDPSEVRVNVGPVSGPTSCSPTPTPGQQAGSQATENPFMNNMHMKATV